MKKRIALVFILLSICSNFYLISAYKRETTQGIYTIVNYTSECFPDYEEFVIEFFIKRTPALNIFSNETLYLTGYRVVLNTTLLAYVRYSTVEEYIPELQKIRLKYDRTDWNLTKSDYNAIHKLTIQISATAIDPTGKEHKVADDLITADVYFMREATANEIINIILITTLPLVAFFAVFNLRNYLNRHNLENVTYTNMFHFIFRHLKRNRSEKDG